MIGTIAIYRCVVYIIDIYFLAEGIYNMSRATAKVFMTGRSQAVRIPKGFRFDTEEVYIEQHGRKVVLTPKPKSWNGYFTDSKRFSDDFPDRIEDTPAEERERL